MDHIISRTLQHLTKSSLHRDDHLFFRILQYVIKSSLHRDEHYEKKQQNENHICISTMSKLVFYASQPVRLYQGDTHLVLYI